MFEAEGLGFIGAKCDRYPGAEGGLIIDAEGGILIGAECLNDTEHEGLFDESIEAEGGEVTRAEGFEVPEAGGSTGGLIERTSCCICLFDIVPAGCVVVFCTEAVEGCIGALIVPMVGVGIRPRICTAGLGGCVGRF